jgi:hypothetical protein
MMSEKGAGWFVIVLVTMVAMHTWGLGQGAHRVKSSSLGMVMNVETGAMSCDAFFSH